MTRKSVLDDGLLSSVLQCVNIDSLYGKVLQQSKGDNLPTLNITKLNISNILQTYNFELKDFTKSYTFYYYMYCF